VEGNTKFYESTILLSNNRNDNWYLSTEEERPRNTFYALNPSARNRRCKSPQTPPCADPAPDPCYPPPAAMIFFPLILFHSMPKLTNAATHAVAMLSAIAEVMARVYASNTPCRYSTGTAWRT
jgi:hypothetical protein